MTQNFVFSDPQKKPRYEVNLFELGYRSLYLHVGEAPLLLIFSLGFRTVVEVSEWCKKNLDCKVVWVTPNMLGFSYHMQHDVLACDFATLYRLIGLRQKKDNIVSILVHMASPHTGSWQIKNKLPTVKVIPFFYDIMSLWVPRESAGVWDQYGDAKGSNPAEYTALEEVLRGDYVDGYLFKDWGHGWPLFEKTGLPSAWWPSTISEKMYQKPPRGDSPPWESFVYVGTIMPKSTHQRPAGLFSDIMMEKIFQEVALQRFPVHAYVMNPAEEVLKEYHSLFPGASGVKLFPGANLHELLPRAQGRYKWGWMMYHYPEKRIMGLVENSLPTKIFTYMGLCTPIVVSEEMTRTAAFVKKHQIGIIVSQQDIQNLRSILANADYEQMVRNILKTRHQYSIEAFMKSLGELVQTVMAAPRRPIPEKPDWVDANEKFEKERAQKKKEAKKEDEPKQDVRSGWRTYGGEGEFRTDESDSSDIS
jgi:hypothetical protein